MSRVILLFTSLLLLGLLPPLGTARDGNFVAFESGQVRPLALSPNGNLLYAVNTPDNRLEVFRIGKATLTPVASVPVGMEPVAVAVRGPGEIWVVNKLSDSVSIVRGDADGLRVVRTLAVGDEPQDIVFAGADRRLAFISAARRDLARPPEPLIGNADIWVYEAEAALTDADAAPLTRINLFTDVPRGLAVSRDGNTVYAASHLSGNLTSSIAQTTVGADVPPPFTNADGVRAPSTAVIVRYEDGRWLDAINRDWSASVPYALTDDDLFIIDAGGEVPQLTNSIASVGTVLFNVAVNPVNGAVYVSNLSARNRVRFEGPGEFFPSTVRGDIARNRITIIDGDRVTPRHLNKHIDFDRELGTPEENAASLAFPLQMTFTADGATVYVAAFGSSKLGVFDSQALEDGSFWPDAADHIELPGGGPSGIVLDEARAQAYVLTRFANSVTLVDLEQRRAVAEFPLYNPEPESVVAGRRFLYDARYSSSRGNAACASCHIFGDKDELAWNLGDPDGEVLANPNPFVVEPQPDEDISFHPMKGPMTTQSLRGMANHGPMHWRGDRTGGNDPDSGDPLDEAAAFGLFNPAFVGLLGRETELTDAEMRSFTAFALQLTYPPNPLRPRDNSLSEEAARGRDFYFEFPTFLGRTCNECHRVSPDEGFYGTSGLSINVRRPQVMKVPHLRNAYTKVGRTRDPFTGEAGPIQFKGFAYGHAGSTPTIEDLLAQQDGGRFDFPGGPPQRRDVAHWVLNVDSNLAPVVGMQVTVGADRSPATNARLALLLRRARVRDPRPECDLIAKARVAGAQRGWLLDDATGLFRPDAADAPPVSLLDLGEISTVPGQEITFTCVPPGSGVRMGIDRDDDGVLDADEPTSASGHVE